MCSIRTPTKKAAVANAVTLSWCRSVDATQMKEYIRSAIIADETPCVIADVSHPTEPSLAQWVTKCATNTKELVSRWTRFGILVKTAEYDVE